MSTQTDGHTLCGKWMPRKRTTCGRRSGHLGDCRSVEAMADTRQRKTERRRGTRVNTDPAVRARWAKAHKLSRYRLTQEDFDRLLEIQGRLRDVPRAVRERPADLYRPRPRLLQRREAVVRKVHSPAAVPVVQYGTGSHRAQVRHGPRVPGQSPCARVSRPLRCGVRRMGRLVGSQSAGDWLSGRASP